MPRYQVLLLRWRQLHWRVLPPAPRQTAHPDYGTAGRERNPEHFGNRKCSDFEADAALRNIEDETLDPRRIRCRNDVPQPPVLYPLMLACSEVFAMPHDHPSISG